MYICLYSLHLYKNKLNFTCGLILFIKSSIDIGFHVNLTWFKIILNNLENKEISIVLSPSFNIKKYMKATYA